MSQILAEIMVDVEKTLLMGGPFEDFLGTGRRCEKTVGGFRQRTIALHGRKREKGIFRETGGFFCEACDI